MSDSKAPSLLVMMRARLLQTYRAPWRPRMRRWARAIWKFLDVGRRASMNLVFGLVLLLVLISMLGSDGPKFADRNALVLAPRGTLVEQLSSSPTDKLVGQLTGGGAGETLLKDVVDTIEAARDDKRIDVLVLDLSRLDGGGLTKLQDLGRAIDGFKTSGKPVIATADGYSQASYYLAARADQVYMHPMGQLLLEGYGRFRTYYGDAIERLEVDWNIFKVGTFKSAVEPYMRSDMSPAAREANLAYLGDIWTAYTTDVAAARGLEASAIDDYAQNIHVHIQTAGGDAARAATTAGLIDAALTRDEVRARLIELVGEDEETHSYNAVSGGAYLAQVREREPSPRGDGVGVIVAKGTIMDGSQPSGTIGGDSLAKLIRQARHDDRIKAIVMRVDSPGGSAFASEIIRRELELAREDGKPVVISMGGLAASGGYWISMASDEVWAHPTTLTGSIGIFGMFPTFEKPLAKLAGVHVDGVGTAPAAGVRPERSIPPHLAQGLQRSIERGYERFLGVVSQSRGMAPEAVDKVAQGRIWSGEDALEHGLVDKLGTLDDAIASAASLAELGDDYATHWVRPELSFKDRMVKKLTGAAVDAAVEQVGDAGGGPYTEMLGFLHRQAQILGRFNDPRGLYAYEMIDVD